MSMIDCAVLAKELADDSKGLGLGKTMAAADVCAKLNERHVVETSIGAVDGAAVMNAFGPGYWKDLVADAGNTEAKLHGPSLWLVDVVRHIGRVELAEGTTGRYAMDELADGDDLLGEIVDDLIARATRTTSLSRAEQIYGPGTVITERDVEQAREIKL